MPDLPDSEFWTANEYLFPARFSSCKWISKPWKQTTKHYLIEYKRPIIILVASKLLYAFELIQNSRLAWKKYWKFYNAATDHLNTNFRNYGRNSDLKSNLKFVFIHSGTKTTFASKIWLKIFIQCLEIIKKSAITGIAEIGDVRKDGIVFLNISFWFHKYLDTKHLKCQNQNHV